MKPIEYEQKDVFQEDLKYTSYIGQIVDSDDPLFLGRCKINVFSKFDGIDKDKLPWCFPISYNFFGSTREHGGGNFSYPKKGAIVHVRFYDGDRMHPVYYSNERTSDTIRDFVSDSYKNSHVLIYDEDENMRFTYKVSEGLMVYHKKSYMNIRKNTNIDIHHADNESRIQLNNGNILHNSNTSMKFKTTYFKIDCDILEINAKVITINGDIMTANVTTLFPKGHTGPPH